MVWLGSRPSSLVVLMLIVPIWFLSWPILYLYLTVSSHKRSPRPSTPALDGAPFFTFYMGQSDCLALYIFMIINSSRTIIMFGSISLHSCLLQQHAICLRDSISTKGPSQPHGGIWDGASLKL